MAVIEPPEAGLPADIIAAVSALIPPQILEDEEQVRRELPHLLGKLLALCWINQELSEVFLSDARTFLDAINLKLPQNIAFEVKREIKAKPSITVYQIKEGSKFKQRLFKLSLKLIANR